MGDTSGFTFCQIGLQVDDDRVDSHEIIPNIHRMTLEENNLNGDCVNKVGNSMQEDNLHDNERNETSGSKGPRSSNVEDMLPSDQLAKSLTGKALGENGLLNQSQEQKSVIKKSAVRAKVPFEKGFSSMDWLKLTRTAADLAGLKGQSNRRLISSNEVKQHKSEGSIWTVLKGRVYNITPYMRFHSGGVDMLKKAAGRDCTSLFSKYHAWVNDEFLLEKCRVGFSDDSL